MDNFGDVFDHNQTLESPGCRLRRFSKIMSCGSMIGTAILFPLANTGGIWFRAVTISIFIPMALIFHALQYERFVRFGPYTAPVALFLLLLAVLPADSSREELVPWLPLFIVSLSLTTVAIDKASQHLGSPRSLVAFKRDVDELSGVSIDSWSDCSAEALSDLYEHRPPSESYRFNPIFFGRHGPSSQCSQWTGSSASVICLSDVMGQRQADWDPLTQTFFAPDVITDATMDAMGLEPELEMLGQPIWISQDHDFDEDLDSEHPSGGSKRPLLGP